MVDSPSTTHGFDVRKLNEQLDDFDEWVGQIAPAVPESGKQAEDSDVDSSGDEFASDSDDESAAKVKTGWSKKSEGDGALDAILGGGGRGRGEVRDTLASPSKSRRSTEDNSRRSRSPHRSDTRSSSKPKSYSKSPVRPLKKYDDTDEAPSASRAPIKRPSKAFEENDEPTVSPSTSKNPIRKPSKAFDSLASSEHGSRTGRRAALTRSMSMKMYSTRPVGQSRRPTRKDDLSRSEHGDLRPSSSRRPARKDDLSRSEHGDIRPSSSRRAARKDELSRSEHGDRPASSRRTIRKDDLSRSEHGDRRSRLSRRGSRKDLLTSSEDGDQPKRLTRRGSRKDLLAGSDHGDQPTGLTRRSSKEELRAGIDNGRRSKTKGELSRSEHRQEQRRSATAEESRYNKNRRDHSLPPNSPGDGSSRRRRSRGASVSRDEDANSRSGRRVGRRDELSRSDHGLDRSPRSSRPPVRRAGDELSRSEHRHPRDPSGSKDPESYDRRARRGRSDPLSMSEHGGRSRGSSRSSRRVRTPGPRRVNSSDNLDLMKISGSDDTLRWPDTSNGPLRKSGSNNELRSLPPKHSDSSRVPRPPNLGAETKMERVLGSAAASGRRRNGSSSVCVGMKKVGSIGQALEKNNKRRTSRGSSTVVPSRKSVDIDEMFDDLRGSTNQGKTNSKWEINPDDWPE